MDIRPFTVDVSEPALVDLRERIARTRWPDQYEDGGWELGTDKNYLRELSHIGPTASTGTPAPASSTGYRTSRL
jgi:hypothetical protein